MKIRSFTVKIKPMKERQPWAPLQRSFRNKKNYNRKTKHKEIYA